MTVLKTILDLPQAYRTFMRLTGNLRARRTFAIEAVRAKPGDRVLDIGCGTGEMLPFMPKVTYHGFDMNPRYINWAHRKFADKGVFRRERVSVANLGDAAGAYDVVIASGLLHHLDDAEAMDLFRLGFSALCPGGRMVTLDGCYTDNQSALEHWILANDRGRFVRTQEEYLHFARAIFPQASARLYHGLLYFPYTLVVLECQRPGDV